MWASRAPSEHGGWAPRESIPRERQAEVAASFGTGVECHTALFMCLVLLSIHYKRGTKPDACSKGNEIKLDFLMRGEARF